jgi:starch phosphorylase
MYSTTISGSSFTSVEVDGGAPDLHAMTREASPDNASGRHVHVADVPAGRPATDYTPRLVPFHPDAAVPLEAPFILWQR